MLELKYVLYVELPETEFRSYKKYYLSQNTVDDDQPQQYVWQEQNFDNETGNVLGFSSPDDAIEWLNNNTFEKTTLRIKLETLVY